MRYKITFNVFIRQNYLARMQTTAYQPIRALFRRIETKVDYNYTCY